MAFQAAVHLAVGEELLLADRAHRPQHRVVQRGGVPLGEDEMVVAGRGGLGEVVVQVPPEQHRHQVGR
jgi:hypothetical protein